MSSISDVLNDEWSYKLKVVESDCNDKINAMATELGKVRAAFNGDSSGWEEIILPSGVSRYNNSITGETTMDEPEIFYIAKLIRQVDNADGVSSEFEELKRKYKELEFKRREADLANNKLKTELSYLRNAERMWKEASKNVSTNLLSVTNSFFAQCDQVIVGLGTVGKSVKRVQQLIPSYEKSKEFIIFLKNKVETLQAQVITLNGKLRDSVNSNKEKEKRIEVLSVGLGEELDRLLKPVRERLAQCMINFMKEKANRSQERRELASLWPTDHILPSVLMKHRVLNDDEKNRRINEARENNANLALTMEVRHNVAESKMWEMKYDDYGRPYYEHSNTGQVLWEEPEIRQYKPPDGRDEMGNVIQSEEEIMSTWKTLATDRGEIYFQNIYCI